MALPTFVTLINKVLKRLRETTVNSVADSDYAALIGEFVNIVKRETEEDWQWRSLRTTIDIAILADSATVLYSLVGSGERFEPISVWNLTLKAEMEYKSNREIDQLKASNFGLGLTSAQTMYYTFRGLDASGDTQVEVWPPATAAQTVRFNCYIPQDDLVNDTDTMKVPQRPVVEGAVSLAIAERGEDGGLPSQVQAARAKDALSDAIGADMGQSGDDEQTFQSDPIRGSGVRTWP